MLRTLTKENRKLREGIEQKENMEVDRLWKFNEKTKK